MIKTLDPYLVVTFYADYGARHYLYWQKPGRGELGVGRVNLQLGGMQEALRYPDDKNGREIAERDIQWLCNYSELMREHFHLVRVTVTVEDL